MSHTDDIIEVMPPTSTDGTEFPNTLGGVKKDRLIIFSGGLVKLQIATFNFTNQFTDLQNKKNMMENIFPVDIIRHIYSFGAGHRENLRAVHEELFKMKHQERMRAIYREMEKLEFRYLIFNYHELDDDEDENEYMMQWEDEYQIQFIPVWSKVVYYKSMTKDGIYF